MEGGDETMKRWRTQIVREDAGESMELRAPSPPEVVWKGRVICGHCSTTFEPYDKYDTHPQCPLCGGIVDLTEYLNTGTSSVAESVKPH
jgi:hypothetical protein